MENFTNLFLEYYYEPFSSGVTEVLFYPTCIDLPCICKARVSILLACTYLVATQPYKSLTFLKFLMPTLQLVIVDRQIAL